ncbi:MAG: energy-coupling factor ABC transporter permease [Gammaproteobacteria bacterium]
MNIPHGMLPPTWLLIGLAIYLLTWWVVLRTSPWKRLLDNSLSHGFLGTCVLILVLWHITTQQLPGLNYHYLGATLLALMFRWQLAFVGVNLVLVGMWLSGDGHWQTLPINALTMGLIPILVSYGIYRLVDSKLPNHLFVYLFLNAFFGAALTIGVAFTVSGLLLTSAGVYHLDYLVNEYFPFLPLMMFPESFITGMLMTLAVVFYPQWVLTFDDARYLNK